MAHDSFNEEYTRLARLVDPVGHDHRLWEKADGAKLDKALDLLATSFTEMGGEIALQKVDSGRHYHRQAHLIGGTNKRLMALIQARFEGDCIVISAKEVDGSDFEITNGMAGKLRPNQLSAETVRAAAGLVLGRIQTKG